MFDWLLIAHMVHDNRGRGLSHAVDRFSKPTRLRNFRIREVIIFIVWIIICVIDLVLAVFSSF